MFRVVRIQFVTALIVAALAGAIAGGHAALSALLGGLACVVPNGMFALHVALHAASFSRKRQGPGGESNDSAGGSAAGAPMLAILLGEFFKVLLTLALLALAAVSDPELVWPALIASICAVLLVQPAAFARRRA